MVSEHVQGNGWLAAYAIPDMPGITFLPVVVWKETVSSRDTHRGGMVGLVPMDRDDVLHTPEDLSELEEPWTFLAYVREDEIDARWDDLERLHVQATQKPIVNDRSF